MEQEVLFIGFKCFKSKSEKMCYILNFLTPPIHSQDNNSCYSTTIDVFTEVDKYNAFVKSHEILKPVKIHCEIVGDKVRYSI